MRRTLFESEHDQFRAVVREFLARKVVPEYPRWLAEESVPREFFAEIAGIGVQGMAFDPAYGGAGIADYRYNMVVQEEAARAHVTLGTLRTQTDVIAPYFLTYSNDEQRDRWFPGIASGRLLTAIAMTEPGTGSDLAGVSARAVRDGDHYIINGAKTFITGGGLADLVIVLARTSVDDADRRAGLSLIVVEADTPGFAKGRRLPKLGLHVQDTVELSFHDTRVPVANLLGEEGRAFGYLGHNLAQERLAIAVGAMAQAGAAVELTLDYVRGREVFGTTVASFQNTKFELAGMSAELEAAQAMIDRAVLDLVDGQLSGADAARVKLFVTEMQGRVADRCLQLFGGYGYITDLPIARLYADARVSRIYGGTSEVMKSIIAKSLGL
ncbi:acyl-CoA dehydrogenase [Mycolicibacter terrae]|uniref:Acyl-[acyl-carrier-protein] dehydrogenase MbtN n=1 Tax=Mycolicibacter terrae TaxID=1788 RepID=A0AAD1HUH3_9MYCO|nr:acyl-CoA dehydrogenase family protein [Mycolicibacter terrae]ORW98050.1 acyl-CoA dehydrogenase [Mycolicibacter terrae]BBX21712.1 acyl-CoA dehydrogenase [Mycolicibacter terrae]SNV86419.1 acyl-CoA dehydrogenase domain-containing protein [Mycolicibacter terrae]